MAGPDAASGTISTPVYCQWPNCSRGLTLLGQLDDARSESLRLRETADAVADANAHGALLMVELEDAKQLAA